MIKQHTLLIDGNAVAYTINIQYVKDEKDFCRQFLGRLREYAKQFSSINTKAILFFDDKYNNWREKLYPDYQKARREAKYTEQQKQEAQLRSKYLKYIKQKFDNSSRYMYVHYPSTETDDLIALYCNNIQQSNETITILTTDKDLFQLIREDKQKPVRVLFLIHRKLVTSQIEGQKILKKKIWLGDNSDSIPGICHNVGEKSLADFEIFIDKMKETGTDPTDKENAKRICESAGIKYVPSFSNYNQEQFEINTKLIDLSYVIKLDADNNNEKTTYLMRCKDKAKFSPGSLYSFSNLV